MGLNRKEVLSLTLSEFNLMHAGYKKRNEKEWDIARRTWGYIMVYGGLGLKKDQKVNIEELWKLPFTDKKDGGIRKITTLKQAMALLKEF
ncbi:hypothetical protein OHD16_06725 [Sphingobacterium sp. ML3W]|uniref:hypothetical protein n=1 Tax=Sphingobacterium sp. ML3W TaxID=1538644 RepID=UPI00249CC695|nr:hypothetical protein [Sphingobacterium sp. ML3W]WFA79663.1 hypothetical protein OGI71_26965 [Sphingobacterium sp. ML3W]